MTATCFLKDSQSEVKAVPINVPPVPRYWKKTETEKWKIFHVLQVTGAGNLS
jgi:hypothetical protein